MILRASSKFRWMSAGHGIADRDGGASGVVLPHRRPPGEPHIRYRAPTHDVRRLSPGRYCASSTSLPEVQNERITRVCGLPHGGASCIYRPEDDMCRACLLVQGPYPHVPLCLVTVGDVQRNTVLSSSGSAKMVERMIRAYHAY